MCVVKMHGSGHDYVYVDGASESVADPAALARTISDRHFGVGGDGLILVMPSDTADVRMWMFNADGSEAEMCGNGIRCVAKYAYDHGLSSANPMRVETADGIKTLQLQIDAGGKVAGATVDMGTPVLTPPDLPVDVLQTPPVAVPLTRGMRLSWSTPATKSCFRSFPCGVRVCSVRRNSAPFWIRVLLVALSPTTRGMCPMILPSFNR